MAYSDLTAQEVETGKPVTATMLDKVKENFSDHENRLQDLEGGVTSSPPCIILRINGPYSDFGAMTGYLETTININIRLTGARLIIATAGSSGTTTADLKYSRAGGAFTTVFDTLPSVAFGAGNYAVSSNAVLDATDKDLQAGDILRLDLTTVQAAANSCFLRLDYERI
jgi:hypothetical protein